MIGDQGSIARGLVDELLETVHRYDGTLYMSTVVGCMELAKQQLILDHIDEGEDE